MRHKELMFLVAALKQKLTGLADFGLRLEGEGLPKRGKTSHRYYGLKDSV